jgi:hypothetical protein
MPPLQKYLFLIVSLFLGSNVAEAQREVPVRVAEGLLRADSSLRQLWPGFWTEGPLVALSPAKGKTLVVHGPDVRLASVIEELRDALPESLKGRASFVSDPGPLASYGLFAEIGGKAMVSVRVFGTFAPFRQHSEAVPWTGDSVATMTVTAVHESFHLYQWREFTPSPGQPLPFANIMPVRPHQSWLDSSWVQEALRRERTSLSRALSQTSCDQVQVELNRYTEQRDDRLVKMPRPFAAYENAHERAEGLANRIGYVGLSRVAPDMLSDADVIVQHDLANSYLGESGRPYAGWSSFATYHLYVVGAAKSSLLSRCGPADWQRRVQAGESLQQVLSRR